MHNRRWTQGRQHRSWRLQSPSAKLKLRYTEIATSPPRRREQGSIASVAQADVTPQRPPARSWAVIEGVAEHLKDDHRRSLTTVAESGRYPALTQPQRRTAVPPEGLANHNHRGADVHPAIEINCVHVAHTDAARRNVPANFRRLVRAVDADERVAIVNEKI
jgi:hypothetical protein